MSLFLFSVFPCRGAEKHQHGENLKPADKHGQGEQKLDRIGEKGVIIHGAYLLKAGAYV